MTSPPLQSREQEARDMLAATEHRNCASWVTSLNRATGDKCDCDRNVRAMIAFADAERERCARIAEETNSCGEQSDFAAGFDAASDAIAAAIRNPLYQHGESK